MTRISTCIFDAYGTLFDVNAAARALAEDPAHPALVPLWQQVAADWRMKQLEYSWLRAVSGDYCDFWQVTEDGLDWALERAGLTDHPTLREALLGLYWHLAAYPDVPGMLRRLKAGGLSCAILSNGSPKMLDGAVSSAGIGADLDAVLSVESVGNFKPDRRVYDMVGARFGCLPEEVLFVSSNGWDACAGAAYGFRTLWVNRAGLPMDRLPGRPHHVAADLTAVPDMLRV